ncbi:MucR family transcriptional regulator [Sphingomonas endophytica]|uniref:Transcriptional regulator n=1 Tax=Sphingomonas endophytica TaxID=869719 RepID=A0A147HXQ0_9SPHN|nr:MucR family transcriptional regulator [Sphingomonas endophytica]KTT69708.1 transcriptional regulator [Sphingomonas endophytica]
MSDDTITANAVELATELTIAWLANPNTRASGEDVPAFLRTMHDAVTNLSSTTAPATQEEPSAEYIPAVSVRKSLASKDHLISLIDGKPYKTLRRHLAGHGLTPDEYRQRYGLKPDYPMVAESYSEARRDMAKKIGLGRKPGARRGEAPAAAEAPASGRGRRKSAATEG